MVQSTYFQCSKVEWSEDAVCEIKPLLMQQNPSPSETWQNDAKEEHATMGFTKSPKIRFQV